MSYCRWGQESDLYMYCCGENKFMFHCCTEINGKYDFCIKGEKEALEFLYTLRNSGVLIPDYAFERLKEEIDE